MTSTLEYKKNPDLPFVEDRFKGNLFIDGQFTNGSTKDPQPISRLLKWVVTPNKQRSEKLRDAYVPQVDQDKYFISNTSDAITWLGHASFHIKISGKTILTDPVFFDLPPFLKRKHKQPCKVEDFNQIDYVLLSHGHMDHLDKKTIQLLIKNHPSILYLCPLGIGKILRSWGVDHIQEAAWFQMYDLPDLDIVFLPAKHWNRRSIFDYNDALWGSFALYNKEKNKSIYFGGDTGFGDHFELIRSVMGKFDNCILPIGAYKPRFMMKHAHMSPAEALNAFDILKGSRFIPMHFGTYDLSDEPAGEGIHYCRSAFHNGAIDGKFDEPIVGKAVQVL